MPTANRFGLSGTTGDNVAIRDREKCLLPYRFSVFLPEVANPESTRIERLLGKAIVSPCGESGGETPLQTFSDVRIAKPVYAAFWGSVQETCMFLVQMMRGCPARRERVASRFSRRHGIVPAHASNSGQTHCQDIDTAGSGLYEACHWRCCRESGCGKRVILTWWRA